MLIKNATREQIEQALRKANEHFEGNLVFNRFDFAGRTRDGSEKWNVTLKVYDSHKPGHGRGFTGKRTAGACWHAHGHFLDALPESAEIRTTCGSLGTITVYPGQSWNDFNIRNVYQPLYASGACDCGFDDDEEANEFWKGRK